VRVATRHCAAIAALALAASIRIWPAWLSPERVDPCAHPDLLAVTGLIPGTTPTGQRRERLNDDVIQWSEGALTEDDFAFRLIRSYNVRQAAERPLLLLPHKNDPERLALEWVDAPGGPLPVHTVRTTGFGSFDVVAYLYVLGNQPVSSPFLAGVRGAFGELRTGKRPLSVFLAAGPATPDTEQERRDVAVSWVVAAWSHYRSVCMPSAPRR
jgi:hypothetical protein